jgi:hypothetical protein
VNTDISKYFTEPGRCLSLSWIFRCKKPVGHEGEHQAGKTTWGRRAEDERHDSHPPGVVAYRSEDGHFLRCLQHWPDPSLRATLAPVTAEDLPDGGVCTELWCGADVLIPRTPS